MAELIDTENFLDTPSARKHRISWFRERLLVFVPDVETEQPPLDDPDKPNVVRAINTVVSVSEAPFLESFERLYAPVLHYVCVGSAIAGNNHRPRILETIRRYGEQHGQLFKARIQDVVRTDMTIKGTFMGTALFVPDNNELPRGYISCCLYSDSDDRDRTPIAEGKAVLTGSSDGTAAAFYAMQDRAILGIGNGMPATFAFADETKLNLLRRDTVLAILPASVENPKPRLLMTRMDRQTADLLMQDQTRASMAKQSTSPQSVLENDAGAEDNLQDIVFDDQSGQALCRLQRVVQDAPKRYSAELRIVPNDSSCRLRHEPPRDVDNFFSIAGILLPSPVGDNDSSEICLNFRPDGHFTGHALDSLSNCTLLRTASDILSRLKRIMDEALLADVSGVTDVIRLWDSKDGTPVGAHHRLLLLSERKRPEKMPINPLYKSGTGTFLGSFGRKRQYYLLTPREPKGVLGYMVCPVRHTIHRSEVKPGENARISRASVVFSRGDAVEQSICCLDWLDEAVQVTYQRSGRGGQPEPMGFARYWNEQRLRLGASVAARQSFELVTTPDDDERYSLNFVERIDDREERLALFDGAMIRVGPLLCQYHHVGRA